VIRGGDEPVAEGLNRIRWTRAGFPGKLPPWPISSSN
jgi:hypothetical protein